MTDSDDRFKEYLREKKGSQIIHLKYDVKIATCTRILDEMPEVQLINCTSDRLDIILMPNSDVDLVSREFQQGCVVALGVEWQCQSV